MPDKQPKRPQQRSTNDGSVRSAADLMPVRPNGPPKRQPRWEAAEDSDVYVSDILAAAPSRSTLVETRGPALVIVVEIDAAPWIAPTRMTPTEEAAYTTYRQYDLAASVLLDTFASVSN